MLKSLIAALHRALGSYQCPSIGGIIAQKKAGGGDQSGAAAQGECEIWQARSPGDSNFSLAKL